MGLRVASTHNYNGREYSLDDYLYITLDRPVLTKEVSIDAIMQRRLRLAEPNNSEKIEESDQEEVDEVVQSDNDDTDNSQESGMVESDIEDNDRSEESEQIDEKQEISDEDDQEDEEEEEVSEAESYEIVKPPPLKRKSGIANLTSDYVTNHVAPKKPMQNFNVASQNAIVPMQLANSQLPPVSEKIKDSTRNDVESKDMQRKSHKCPKCEKKFSRSCEVLRHIRSVHDQIKLICEKCKKTFARKDNLKKHSQICLK
jgi:hypothetical protein